MFFLISFPPQNTSLCKLLLFALIRMQDAKTVFVAMVTFDPGLSIVSVREACFPAVWKTAGALRWPG